MWGADAVLWSAPTGVRMYMCGISGGRGPVILDGELIDSRDGTAVRQGKIIVGSIAGLQSNLFSDVVIGVK